MPIPRSMRTRAGGRPMKVNNPDGWLGNRIAAPSTGGVDNPGFTWVMSDNPSAYQGSGAAGTKLAAVHRAIELISGTIGGLPWRVRRNDTETLPTPAWIEDPQLSRWDSRVADGDLFGFDNRLTAMAFREQMVTSMLLYGNAYVYIPQRKADGTPQAPVFLLHPDGVDIRDGRYWVDNYQIPSGGIIHIRGTSPLDDQGKGVGVITGYAQSLGLLAAAQAYAVSTFENPVPTGVLEVSQPNLSQAQSDALKAAWTAAHGGVQRSVAVLNSTVAFKPLSLSPVDTAVVQMTDVGLRDVALAFGLDPSWFGVPGSSLTYNTVVLRAVELRQFSLLNHVRRIESAYDAELAKGTELDIVMDGIERGSTSERYAVYETALRAGFATVDEVRYLEGWTPLGHPTGGWTGIS